MARGSQNSQRGFAAMDPEERREIARRGGQASHSGSRDWDRDEDERGGSRQRRPPRYEARYEDENEDYGEQRGGRSRRGFAAMDPEEQREIASRGGRASHGGRGRNNEGRYHDEDQDDEERYSRSGRYQDEDRYEDEDEDESNYRSNRRNYDDEDERSYGRSRGQGGGRGFASMDPEERREIARRGGQASHGGRGRNEGRRSQGDRY